jgi:hypothetical protein
MNALQKAKQLVEDAYYDERDMADVMHQDAAIYAVTAAAQAAQPRFIRIGNETVNVTHTVRVREVSRKNYDGQIIDLDVTGGEVNDVLGAEYLWYIGEEASAVASFLRDLLRPMLAAEIDLPTQLPQREPESARIADDDEFSASWEHYQSIKRAHQEPLAAQEQD